MNNDVAVLCWLHIGDLHVTDVGGENYRDLLCIAGSIRDLPPGAIDFAVLPGDNADDGTPEQFALVREAVRDLPVPLHILPGDHDFKPCSLDAFYRDLGAPRLPRAARVPGYRCLFLDVVSAGSGGPDFRLADDQLAWAEHEVAAAATSGEGVAVFMHTYPADLQEGAERLRRLLSQPHILCVDMGHTHYNELANDGRTVFMATRSTGQIEEGPAGFSLAAIDEAGVSWRFKPLDRAWPLVLITSPVDRRLATAASPAPTGMVRAKIIGDAPIETAELGTSDGRWHAMQPAKGGAGLWQSAVQTQGPVIVRARDTRGRWDEDRVEPAGSDWQAPSRVGDGSDKDRIGAWPERGILGTQLGPNRNGRQW